MGKTLYGGNQEKGFRPGTLNVPGIVGFGAACSLAKDQMNHQNIRLQKLRNRLENQLLQIDGARINCQAHERLPNTTNVSFSGIDGSKLLLQLKDIAVSRGSACNANLVSPSHVLKAIGHSDELALGSLRISLGKHTTEQEVDRAVESIRLVVNQLKTVSI